MRLGCIPPLIAIGLLGGGGQGAYTWLSNREPKVLNIDEYLAKMPSDKWVRITGGTTDFASATSVSNRFSGQVTEVFVPIRSTHGSDHDPVKILMATKNPVMLEAIEKTKAMEPMQALNYFVQHHQDLVAQRDVEGLIRFGIESKDKEERKLRATNANIAKDCVILDEGKKPEPLLSVCLLGAGILLAGFLVKRARSSDDSSSGTLTTPPPSVPPPLPPPPSDPPLRQS